MILKVTFVVLLASVCLAQEVPLDGNCPPEGVFASPHDKACDAYYKCENGTYSEEVCPNGLLFAGHPSVHDFCNYNWAVDCGHRTDVPGPISSPGCPWQFGLYPSESCTQYIKCEWGQPILSDCEAGLAYEDSIHKCNWPDEVPGCDSEAIIGFTCPDKSTGPSARFDPFPRYPYPPDCTRLITCVNKKPRLIGCGEGSAFNPYTYGCDDAKNVPECKAAQIYKKK